jgi:hypothetical protein
MSLTTDKIFCCIYKYLNSGFYIEEHMRYCKDLNDSCMLSDVTSNDFKRSVLDVYNICKEIGISQINPNTLYKHIVESYILYNREQLQKINVLNGTLFIDTIN